ncbi:MAG: hypothetical protein V4751_06225 [Pseudomonadota bacterium]
MDAPATSQTSIEVVRKKIETDYQEFRQAARNWSGVYNLFQFGSAVLTATGALVLKTELFSDISMRNDVGAALAAIATLAITLMSTGRFKDKWEANRIAAFAVRDLGYEIEKENASTDDILTGLQRIGMTRNNAIIGLSPPSKLNLKS